jgi:plastocyanin
VGVTACGSGGPASGGDASSATVVIENYRFEPADVVVAAGARITVRNDDGVTHTLTAVPDSTPQGEFDTGNLAPGDSTVFDAPAVPGKYAFYCSIATFMTGTLTVRSGATPERPPSED